MSAATSSRTGFMPSRLLPWLAVGLFLVVQLLPLVWIAIASLKTSAELASAPMYTLPSQIDFGNYVRAFSTSPLLRYIGNSVLVAFATIALTVSLAAPAAFAIEKLRFPGAQKVLAYFLLGLMIPVFVALLPTFLAFNAIGLRNTYLALILPQVAFNLPMAIYIYTGFMRNIPDALLEAATIDGAGTFRVFTAIVVPLSTNATVTIAVFNFMFAWNEFVFANTFLNTPLLKTLPVGLQDFVGQYGKTDLGATFAAIVVSIFPTVLLYLFLNRRVIDGMTAGATKG
jgi:raffinose/stachyose/melibiose transport system permease protein